MSEQEPIRLSYVLTPEIYNEAVAMWGPAPASNRGGSGGGPNLYRYLGFVVIGLFVRFGLRASLRSSGVQPDISHDIAFVLGAVVVFAIFRFGLRSNLLGGKTQAQPSKTVQENVKAGFNHEGLRIKSDRGEATYPWSGILETRTGRNCVALWTGTNTIAVPNTALPDSMNPHEFRDQLERWRNA